jgi:hypothetical protein
MDTAITSGMEHWLRMWYNTTRGKLDRLRRDSGAEIVKSIAYKFIDYNNNIV